MRRTIPLLFVSLILPPAVAQAHPVLVFTDRVHTEPGANPPTAPSDSTRRLTVTLGHRYLSVQDADRETIYDFDGNRIYALDLKAHSYREASLYADIGYRVNEFENRLYLDGLMRVVGAVDNPMTTALTEQLFSLSSRDGATVIDQKTAGRETVFAWGDVPLVEVSKRTRALPADYQSELWRFLRYELGGHPQVFAALAQMRGVPERMMILRPNFDRDTHRLTLESLKIVPDVPYSIDGFQPGAPESEPFTTLKLLDSTSPDQLLTRGEQARQARNALAAEGKYLSAFLAYNDYLFSTGDQDVTWLGSQREAFQSDPLVVQLFRALQPRNAVEAAESLTTLSALRATGPAYAHILDVFAANMHRDPQNTAEAEQLYLSALRENPYLVGAWKDLGGLYYGSFRQPEAWACWDAARALQPTHPMLQPVNDLERKLRDKNPEFF